MDYDIIRTAKKVVGTKQTMKMVEKHLCNRVIIADDARPEILAPLLSLCEKNGVEVLTVDSMDFLGELCGIKIGAASAGII
ncbi:MAG: ribosomal L7Ae/L30e/S12e/Gadd45 family protein [Clostridiales bacterium]